MAHGVFNRAVSDVGWGSQPYPGVQGWTANAHRCSGYKVPAQHALLCRLPSINPPPVPRSQRAAAAGRYRIKLPRRPPPRGVQCRLVGVQGSRYPSTTPLLCLHNSNPARTTLLAHLRCPSAADRHACRERRLQLAIGCRDLAPVLPVSVQYSGAYCDQNATICDVM